MTSTVVMLFFLQTVNASEEVELRLQRIKQEAALIEEHSEKLENQKESVLKEEAETSAADPEVCDFIRIINIVLHASVENASTCFRLILSPLASTTLPPSVQVLHLHSTTVTRL